MVKLLSSGNDIGFTILPYLCDTPVEDDLFDYPSDYLIGYITHNNETGERKLTYTDSGVCMEENNHWSLNILEKFPYCDQEGSWIIYNCSPEKTTQEFNKILARFHETLHIGNWDTWSVEGEDATVALITSWEIF